MDVTLNDIINAGFPAALLFVLTWGARRLGAFVRSIWKDWWEHYTGVVVPARQEKERETAAALSAVAEGQVRMATILERFDADLSSRLTQLESEMRSGLETLTREIMSIVRIGSGPDSLDKQMPTEILQEVAGEYPDRD